MAAVALPTSPGPVEAKVRFLDWGGELVPALGGPVQRLSRLGSRHAIDYVLPPMTMAAAMAWIQRLKRGKSDRVAIPYPLLGFAPGVEGTPQIRTSASGGTTIDLRGVREGMTLTEGQVLSIVIGGKRFVHSADASATAAEATHSVVNQANTTVTAAGDIYTVEKTAGAVAFDASATGPTALAGDFVLRVRPLQTNQGVLVGLNDDPTGSTGIDDIDRALYFRADGVLDTKDAAAYSGVDTYNATDYWFIRRRTEQVQVLRGASTDVAAATLKATLTNNRQVLYVDSSLAHVGARFEVHHRAWQFSSVAITPMLRKAVTAGDTVEIETPYIEGYLEGDETSWSLEAARTVGLAFTVVEAE